MSDANPALLFPAKEKALDIWLAYTTEPKPNGNGLNKIPISALTGKRSNSRDQDVSFEKLKVFLAANNGNLAGPAVHIPPGYFVIDKDNCVDSEGNVEEGAAEIVRALPGYWELSPSGSGLHGWFKGTVPGDKCRRGIEIYDGSKTLRFMTVTGHRAPWSTETIEECDIAPVYEKMLRGDFLEQSMVDKDRSSEVSTSGSRVDMGDEGGRTTSD
jgi:putative DNA primase/helicase